MVQATATSTYGIEKVEFYLDNELQETVIEAPYEWKLQNKGIGIFELKVIAYDNNNEQSSDDITVTIASGGGVSKNTLLRQKVNLLFERCIDNDTLLQNLLFKIFNI